MKSSYQQNNYGDVFKAMIYAFKPSQCVELGVLHGYSSYHMAQGLKENGYGKLDSYDLFEDYQYNHGTMDEVKQNLGDLNDLVTLHRLDAFQAHERHGHRSVGLLHIDISNNGDIFNNMISLWDDRMVHGGIIMFEGGTSERDNVEWMVKYNKKPIKPEMERNPIIQEKYVFATYLPYPGLTVFLKKR